MNVTIYPSVPNFLLERFVSFDCDFNGKSWAELYDAIWFLKSKYPNKIFDDTPYVYLDLDAKTHGYLFIEKQSDDLYFVYK